MQHNITCPHCGEAFTIDEAGYADIVQQVRNAEFERELKDREKLIEEDKRKAVELAEAKAAGELQQAIAQKEAQIAQLQAQLDTTDLRQQMAVEQARASAGKEQESLRAQLEQAKRDREHDAELAEARLAAQLQQSVAEKDAQITQLQTKLDRAQLEKDLESKSLKERYEMQLRDRDDEIERMKDFKARLSTKMVGESLEQHCQNEFNSMRMGAFPNAYFEKDNDARTGSKGDFIFRDYDRPEGEEERTEVISIMFEMKNENETTATKHKNEDFFKELDKDRREKGCEYAVLVSMLEADSDLYNQGIVDVSYRYPKMYVIRPQFFIQMITLLRNAALNSLQYKLQLEEMRMQNIDITHFEDRLNEFKSGFERGLPQIPDRDRRDRQVDRPPAEDQAGVDRLGEQPADRQQQGAGHHRAQTDVQEPHDAAEIQGGARGEGTGGRRGERRLTGAEHMPACRMGAGVPGWLDWAAVVPVKQRPGSQKECRHGLPHDFQPNRVFW